jgi:hypothetical protein
MQPYLNAYPIPNGAELGSGTAEFNASYSNPSSLDAYSIRVDHVVNARISNELRANYSNDRVGGKFKMDDFGGAAPLPDSGTEVELSLPANRVYTAPGDGQRSWLAEKLAKLSGKDTD